MSLVLQVTMMLAAVLFIAVSATMNALFLSSLGRTPVEVGLLAAVSIAADVVKAGLPVVIARALVLRAWTHGIVAAVMLVVVIVVSLASGTGFAALTRGAAVATKEASADKLAARQREVRDIEARLEALGQPRPAAVIKAEIAAIQIDRRWQSTKLCTEITSSTARQFCGDVFKQRAELATALERNRLTAERRATRDRIEALQTAGGSAESDPQASAIAALLGVDRTVPRLVMTVSVAVVVELGSVILVLLAIGPTLNGWHEPGTAPKLPAKPAQVPPSPDRAHWHRQRNKGILNGNGGEDHAR